MKRILVMIVVMIAAAAGNAFGECSEADKKTLEAFDRAWSKAGTEGDRAALMSVYADDYVSVSDMLNKTQTIENTMATFERNKTNSPGDAVTHDNYMIVCTPNSATVTHRNTVTVKTGAGGKEETFYTRSVHFLEKRGGKWQVVSNAAHGLDDYAVLEYMEMDWNNAYKMRDAAWFERNFAADMSEVSGSDGKIMNKTEAIAAMKADKTAVDSVKIETINVRVDGDTAIATSIVRSMGRDEKGQPFDRRTRYTDTFIKRDGRWLIWASHGTRIPPVAR